MTMIWEEELETFFTRTNALISKFCRCCITVKLVLFKTFCLCMHDVALWKYYSVTVFNKFKSAYNKCIKNFFGFAKRDSMSGILTDLLLPSADAVVHNFRVLFANQCVMSSNNSPMVQCCDSHIRCMCISTFVHTFVCFYGCLYVFLWT